MKISGIFPPVATPFEENRVAYGRFEENLKKWCEYGLSGFVIFGSNGEYVSLKNEEKLKLIETARKSVPDDKILIAGTGCESTEETIELTNASADAGADYALIINPYYFPLKKEAIINHFYNVAEESKIPILIYNVPKFTGVNLDPKIISKLAEHRKIVGLKDSSGNIPQLGEIIRTTNEDFSALVGTAGAIYPALTIGAKGGILALANIAPKECVEIYENFNNNNQKEARDLYIKMLPVNAAVTATYGVPGLKVALDLLGYYGGEPRKPLMPSNEKEKNEIKQILIDGGLL